MARRPPPPTLAGWGRLAVPGRELRGEDLGAVTAGVPLTRGLGRSYGDASLPPAGSELVAGSCLADRVVAFDATSGTVRAEAGLALRGLNRIAWRAGWSVPVSPGTEEVTLGGMVAADVHGKNHHRAGTIGRHLRALTLRLAGGDVVECSPSRQPELFWATVGGMGLTGHILEVELALERIPSAWVRFRSERFGGLDELAAALRAAGEAWPMTAAWVDGLATGGRLGRGVLLCGRWAEREEAPAAAPPAGRRLPRPPLAPDALLNRATVGAFNRLYVARHPRRAQEGLMRPHPFLYPLDAVPEWSRLYGRRGMIQHQSVLPAAAGAQAVGELLRTAHREGGWPFLVVLKDFGEEGRGLLSFPRPGFTLALDFPHGAGSQALVDRLNARVRELGGRIYLAKDALSRREDFVAMEGARLERFARVRERWDPGRRLRSRLSERLGL